MTAPPPHPEDRPAVRLSYARGKLEVEVSGLLQSPEDLDLVLAILTNARKLMIDPSAFSPLQAQVLEGWLNLFDVEGKLCPSILYDSEAEALAHTNAGSYRGTIKVRKS
jgi:hypothetical protein